MVNCLASHMTKRGQVCDMKKATESPVMQSCVNGPIHLCNVAVFSDADFVGVAATSKPTTGGYAAILGPNSGHRLPVYEKAKPR